MTTPQVHVPRLHRASALVLLVDVQERLWPAMEGAAELRARLGVLHQALRILQIPFVLTEQNPTRLGPTLPELAAPAHAKTCFSGCLPAVMQEIESAGRRQIILCGMEAHVCILQSCLDLLLNGFEVWLPADAIASRRLLDRQIAWERMLRAGAVPTTVESLILEILGDAGSPEWKSLLPLLKA